MSIRTPQYKASEIRYFLQKTKILLKSISFILVLLWKKKNNHFMTNILYLDDLRKGNSSILPSFGSFMCDGAIFSLASQGHLSGITLQVKTDKGDTSFILIWEGDMTLQMHRTMNDDERATDYGAMCIGVFLVLQLTDYQHFITARKKTGIDFWLFKEESSDLDISKADARLEISGIRKESRTNTCATRLKLKIEQVKKSAFTGKTVYIAITEFSNPSSLFRAIK